MMQEPDYAHDMVASTAPGRLPATNPTAATFGIEEEFLLMDPRTAQPVPTAPAVRDGLRLGTDPEWVSSELLDCQVETSTPVCRDLSEAMEALTDFRQDLAHSAAATGAAAAGIGVIYDADLRPAPVTDTPRYRGIAERAPALVADQYVTGMHIHVEVPDPEVRLQVLNRLRPWLPLFTAVAANSPFWRHSDSGFASWRTILYRRWQIQGCPPYFADLHEYRVRVRQLYASGVVPDPGHISWLARLSDHYPTIEVRASDSQLTAADSVLLAGLVRALVATEQSAVVTGRAATNYFPEHLDVALWQAARYGMSGKLVHLDTATLWPAFDVLELLLRHVDDALEQHGDRGWVHEQAARLRLEGTGAQRQRDAMAHGGLPAWLTLVARSLTAG
jgi:glutamate---cysteine ligase / carboxylate-amine ligase